MRWKKIFKLILIFFWVVNLGIAAEEDSAQEDPLRLGVDHPFATAGENTRISLSLRNIDIIEALKFFSMRSGLNIIPTQKVSGRVTLAVDNVPVKDILDIMLRSNSLAYDKRSGIYNVMTEAEYMALYGKKFSDTRKVKIFRLQYAIPEQVFSLLDAIKSDIGRLLVDQESGAVMLIDTPEKIIEAEKTIEALEHKSGIKVFNLQYAKAKDIEEQLRAQLDLKKVGMIRADERTNQVVVQTLPERMSDIEQLIASLDKKTKAVLIDTKIIKIKLTNAMSEGVQWEGLFNVAKQYGMTYMGSTPFSAIQAASAAWRSREQVLSALGGSVGSYPFSGTTSVYNSSTKVTPGKNMHVGIVSGKRDFDMIINYLQTIGKTKIISNPSLSVVNNQEAKIHIGERRAYVTTTTTTGTTTTTVSEEVTYIDTGVQLSVVPTINEDGYVTMKVKPAISSIVGNVTTPSGNVIPVIDTSEAETTVIAKDGATILLGGLGREEKTENTERFPILGKIPVLGFFFRNKTESTERVELLIMMTPVIYEGDKLITPKDKENELFGVKPVRKFDVFRPEVPAPEVSAAGKDEFVPRKFQPYGEGVPVSTEGEKFLLKGVKSGRKETPELKREEITIQKEEPISSEPTGLIVPAEGKGGLIIFKGFKPYN